MFPDVPQLFHLSEAISIFHSLEVETPQLYVDTLLCSSIYDRKLLLTSCTEVEAEILQMHVDTFVFLHDNCRDYRMLAKFRYLL